MEHIEKIGNKVWSQNQLQYFNEALGINVEDVIYKRIFGEEKVARIEDKEYILLPTGNINKRVQNLIVKKIPHNRGSDSISGVAHIINEKLEPITIEGANADYIRESYINHYRQALGEEWSKEDFNNRLASLSYRTYKYAVDKETGEVFVVGFFGVQIATGAGGKYLTNAELYVLPEFRGKGIATELVGQSLDLALEDGIQGFDSLTYKVQGYNPLRFWERIGANSTELYHIAGDVSDMLNNIKQSIGDDQKGVGKNK